MSEPNPLFPRQQGLPPDVRAYHVSEDGVRWRPFDPERDRGRLLHKRIVFEQPAED